MSRSSGARAWSGSWRTPCLRVAQPEQAWTLRLLPWLSRRAEPSAPVARHGGSRRRRPGPCRSRGRCRKASFRHVTEERLRHEEPDRWQPASACAGVRRTAGCGRLLVFHDERPLDSGSRVDLVRARQPGQPALGPVFDPGVIRNMIVDASRRRSRSVGSIDGLRDRSNRRDCRA